MSIISSTGRGALALLCALMLSALVCVSAAAQTGTSSVRGTVTDPQGNAVAGANVTLTNTERNFVRTQTTNESGGYLFNTVPPGTYRVEVEGAGFKKSVATVTTLVDTPLDFDVQMEIGNVTESVTVTAAEAAPL